MLSTDNFYLSPSVKAQVNRGLLFQDAVRAYINFQAVCVVGIDPDNGYLRDFQSQLLTSWQPSSRETGNYALETQVAGSDGELKPSWFADSSIEDSGNPEEQVEELYPTNSELPKVLVVANHSDWSNIGNLGKCWTIPIPKLWAHCQKKKYRKTSLKRTTQNRPRVTAELVLIPCEDLQDLAVPLDQYIRRLGFEF